MIEHSITPTIEEFRARIEKAEAENASLKARLALAVEVVNAAKAVHDPNVPGAIYYGYIHRIHDAIAAYDAYEKKL